MTVIAKTHSPHGLQAVMFSPHGREIAVRSEKSMKNGEYFSTEKKAIHKALHEAIINGNIHATCAVPNLINFDSSMASKPGDYLKSQECELPPTADEKQMQENPSSSNNWLIWLIVIVVIVLILVGLYYWSRNCHAGPGISSHISTHPSSHISTHPSSHISTASPITPIAP